jgi:glycerol uptake facilitator
MRRTTSERGRSGTGSSPAGSQRAAGRQPTTRDPRITRWQRLTGEFLGMALLVFFHAGIATSSRMLQAASGQSKTASGILFVGLSQGLALFAIILIVGRVSGALINPAVTLGLASVGRLERRDVVPYLAVQFGGAVLGAAAIPLAFGPLARTDGRLGILQPAPGVPLWQAMSVEALGTFMLVLVISATAEDPRAPSGWAPLAIGLGLAAIVTLLEPITGAGVNPARAIGPDLLYALAFKGNVDWLTYLVAYLAGPLMGAVAAVWLYKLLTNQPDSKPKPE